MPAQVQQSCDKNSIGPGSTAASSVAAATGTVGTQAASSNLQFGPRHPNDSDVGRVSPPPAPFDGGGGDGNGDDANDERRGRRKDRDRRDQKERRRRPSGDGDGGGDGGGGGGGSFSYDFLPADSDEEARRQRRRDRNERRYAERYKERDPKVAGFLDSARLRAWLVDIYTQVNAAATRLDNKAFIWVRSAQDFNITDEELEDVPPEFRVMSRDICAKLHRLCVGEL